MPILDKATIPGYLDAVARESQSRLLAFAPINETVAGIECAPLTPFRMMLLEAIDSKLLQPQAVIGWHDLHDFFWAISPHYSRRRNLDSWWYKRRIWRSMKGRDIGEVADACANYFEEAWMDAPPSSGIGSSSSHVDFIAALIHALASAYGWSESELLHCPLKRLWQYFNLIRVSKNPNATLHSPSDRIVNQWLARMNTPSNGN